MLFHNEAKVNRQTISADIQAVYWHSADFQPSEEAGRQANV